MVTTYPLNNITYQAEDAELFHATRSSGVFGDDDFRCSVSGADNMVTVSSGIGWIKNSKFSGKVVALKENIALDMGLPDSINPRIDAVVLKYSTATNSTEIVVKKGEASTPPVEPEVVKTQSEYELHLCHVMRKAGAPTISVADVTDLRPNNAYCGYMIDAVSAVDAELKKAGFAADAKEAGDRLRNLATQTSKLNNDLSVERARINNIAKTPNGGTRGDAELRDIRVGLDGTVYSNAGEAVRKQFSLSFMGAKTPLNDNTVDAICQGDADNLPNGKAYSIGLVNVQVENLPAIRGTVLTFGVEDTRRAGDMQLCFDATRDIFSWRQYFPTSWEPWHSVPDMAFLENFPTYRVPPDSVELFHQSARIIRDGFYLLYRSDWHDLPGGTDDSAPQGYVFTVKRYSPNNVLQIVVDTKGNIFTRMVNVNTFAVARDWLSSGDVQPVKILCVGDSIAYGARNGRRGFVGDLGLPYKIAAVSGATLSTEVASITNIPDQLVGVSGYDPDVIIADGGVNDYYQSAPLGDIPTTPVTSDEAAEELDRSTVMGGLQYLLYKMISLYPKANRYFLLTHRTTAAQYTGGDVVDWAISENSAGYTQDELFNAIKMVCAIYSTQIIDVYGESVINTAFDAYKSDVAYTDDPAVTNTEWVDADGIHPLAYGYINGYAPIVRNALKTATVKTENTENFSLFNDLE